MRRLTGSVRLGLPLAALFVAVLSCPTRAASVGASLSNTSGRGPRIVVLAVALDPKIRPQVGLLEHAAEDALTHSARFDVLLGVDAYDPGAQAARGAAALKAASRVKEGRKAIDDLDTTAATAAFVDAVSQYKATNSALTFGSLIDAWVMKAASLASGDAGPAKQDIDRIIALSTRAEFSNQYFPPELLKYADTQKKMAANAKGELIVRTEPPGAAVWVDGQYRGVSPAQVSNIMGGRHLVTAALNGYALGQEEFTPGEGLLSLKPAELQAAVFKAQDAVSKDPEGLTREQAAMTLAKRAGADQVLVLVAKKSLAGEQMELTVVRVDATDGHNWGYQTAVVPLNNEATLSGVIDLVVATDTARLEGRKPVFHLKNSGGSTGKKVAGGILLAAGAGLVGAGVYTGLQAQASVAEYHGIKQVQTGIAQSVASRGRAFSIMADASFVLAAASFVTGTVLLATSGPPKTSEVDEPRPSERTGPSGSTRDEAPPPSKSNTGWGAPAKRDSSDWSKKPDSVDPAKPDEDAQRREAKEREEKEREREAKEAKEREAKAAEEREAEARRKEEEKELRDPKKRAAKKREEERKRKEEERAAKAAEAARREEERRAAKAAEAERRDEEKRRKADEAKAAKAAEAERRDEEKRRKADEAKAAEEKRREDERRAEEAAARKKEEDARAAKAAEEKQREEEAKKKNGKRDDDDLRNY